MSLNTYLSRRSALKVNLSMQPISGAITATIHAWNASIKAIAPRATRPTIECLITPQANAIPCLVSMMLEFHQHNPAHLAALRVLMQPFAFHATLQPF